MSNLRRCLVILGHPDPGSLGAALADAYAEGVEAGGGTTKRITLAELRFDPILRGGLGGGQTLEPDLLRARAAIEWADHVTWLYPVWWGSVPAVLKGFLDRTFLPGWAFNARSSGRPEGLLAGRSARTIVTMDSPGWFDRWFYGASARRQMERATLWYTGFAPVRSRVFTEVGKSNAQTRERWLASARADGTTDARQLRGRSHRGQSRISSTPQPQP